MSAVDTDLTVQISISLRQRFSEHLFCNVIILSLMKQNDHWVKEKVSLKTHKNSQPLQSALGNKSSRHFKNHEKLFLIPSKIIIKELIFINLQTRSLENKLLERYIFIILTTGVYYEENPKLPSKNKEKQYDVTGIKRLTKFKWWQSWRHASLKEA